MKYLYMIRRLLLASSILFSTAFAHGQVYTYNFGTFTDSITSGTATSPTFLPTPPDGSSAYARVGTGGGKLIVKNYANFGTGSSLRIQAPTGTSNNKFSIYGMPGASTTLGLKLTFSLGDSVNSPGSAVTSGTFYFFAGSGNTYSSANGFSGTQTFAGVRMVLGATNAALSVRVPVIGWYTDPTTPITVPYGTPVTVVLYMNNGTTAVTYNDINGVSRSLPAGSTDLFSNGAYLTNVPNAGLTANTNINSFMFYAESSTANQANVFVDDIVYTSNIVGYSLPLKLSFFDAVPDHNSVRLFWKTEVESNIREYVVEHSTDGKNFKPVTTLASQKRDGSNYTFTHMQPAANNFYRLKINSDNGNFDYSQIIATKLNVANAGMKAWYNDNALHLTQHQDATVNIYDLNGRRVVNEVMNNSSYAVDLSFLAPGSYVAHIRNGNEEAVVKFVK